MHDSHPLSRMVGGTHYLTLAVPPFEFAHRNGWDSTSFSILKYLSRYRSKEGLKDLLKSRHIVEIRVEMLKIAPASPPSDSPYAMSMGEYVSRNNVNGADSVALMTLDAWVRQRVGPTVMLSVIDVLIGQYQESSGTQKLPLDLPM